VALEAVRDGAVFDKCLEILPDINFKKKVKLAFASYQGGGKKFGGIESVRV
jgi:hypothetical protein